MVLDQTLSPKVRGWPHETNDIARRQFFQFPRAAQLRQFRVTPPTSLPPPRAAQLRWFRVTPPISLPPPRAAQLRWFRVTPPISLPPPRAAQLRWFRVTPPISFLSRALKGLHWEKIIKRLEVSLPISTSINSPHYSY